MKLLAASGRTAELYFPAAVQTEHSGAAELPAPPNVVIDRIGQGLVRVVLRPGARITREDRAAAREKLFSVAGHEPVGVLLQVTGAGAVNRETIGAYAEAFTVTAFAILGTTPVDRVVAHRLLRSSRPKCPSEYFSDAGQAIDWLRTHAAKS